MAMTEDDVKDAVNSVNFNGPKGFDPLTILTIISVAIQAWKLFQECKAARKMAFFAAKRKGIAYRMFINKTIVGPLKDKGVDQEHAEMIAEALRLKFIEKGGFE